MSDLFSLTRETLRRGIRLPPAGWVLAAILAFYVMAGLFGRDPWKGEDAIHIGAAWHMLNYSDWLSPDIAGRPFHEPPLYYWSAALTGMLFGWLLPLHEAMRVASGIWVALALMGLYYASRELYGEDSAAASPLLLAGCAGLLFHAHDAQPMLIALAAYAGGLGALATIGRKPRLTGIFYGLAVAGCFLGTGLAPTLPRLAIAPVAWWLSPDRPKALHTLLIGLAIAAVLILPWPLLLLNLEPARFHGWLATELAPLKTPFSLDGGGRFIAMLPWFAFPAFPLAIWTLRLRRRDIKALLPPLALLATPGALALRRGAANAFDWFAMSTFSVFIGIVWLAWSAMALGWPGQMAKRAVVLRPGFVGQFELLALIVGLAATAWWIWLIVTAPRSPYRSLTHWTLGCTTSTSPTAPLPRPLRKPCRLITAAWLSADSIKRSLRRWLILSESNRLPKTRMPDRPANGCWSSATPAVNWRPPMASGARSGKATAQVTARKLSGFSGADRALPPPVGGYGCGAITPSGSARGSTSFRRWTRRYRPAPCACFFS